CCSCDEFGVAAGHGFAHQSNAVLSGACAMNACSHTMAETARPRCPAPRSSGATHAAGDAAVQRPCLWVALLLLVVPTANAQRSFSLTLAPTNQNFVKLSWKVQSAT